MCAKSFVILFLQLSDGWTRKIFVPKVEGSILLVTCLRSWGFGCAILFGSKRREDNFGFSPRKGVFP